MILVFTDFGHAGPYMGEMRAALLRRAPAVPVVDLMADAPAFRPDLAAYLLAALWPTALPGDVLLAVVDPGVGTARRPLAVEVDGRWLVGPDNGLFEPILRRAGRWQGHAIAWRPERLSTSFHGRDLFAPVAAGLATGGRPALTPAEPTRFPDWPDDRRSSTSTPTATPSPACVPAGSPPAAASRWRGTPCHAPAPSARCRRAKPSGTKTAVASPRSPSTAAVPRWSWDCGRAVLSA